ncbi:MAG TPA: hypothetical protein VGL19_10700 [Polyangiaceae bacterium]
MRVLVVGLAGRCARGTCLASFLLSACHYDDWALPSGLPAGGSSSSGPSEGSAAGSSGSAAPPAVGGAPQSSAGSAGAATQGAAGGASGPSAAGSSSDAGSPGEGGGAGATLGCDLNAPFDKGVALRFDVNRDRTDGRLSADEKTLYYHAYDGIWVATRPTRDAAFDSDRDLLEQPSVILLLPNIVADGSKLYYTLMAAPPPASSELMPGMYVADRPSTADGDFNLGTRLGAFTAGDGSLFMAPNGDHAYFERDNQLWVAQRAGTDFAPATQLTSLVAPDSFRLMPVVNAEERVLYFASSDGSANYDIYEAGWNDDSAAFEDPKPVTELNGPAPELPSWLSPDGCRLYFHRYDKDWNFPQLMVASKPALTR